MALPPTIQRIVAKMNDDGPAFLSEAECCALVTYQLEETAKWQNEVWDHFWGGGGGQTPPRPPKWPPV